MKNGRKLGPDGTQTWYNGGVIHRDDGPAVIYSCGTQNWFRHGVRHREDGPAIIREDGTQIWYKNGRLHREDGPAVIWSDGTMSWYINDEEVDPLVAFVFGCEASLADIPPRGLI